MSMIINLDGAQQKITRPDLTDAAAAAMIEVAAAAGAEQVRSHLHLCRQTEMDLYNRRKEISEAQEAEGRNNRARFDLEGDESRARNEAELTLNPTGGVRTVPRIIR
jgi:methionine synthase II (cobalamin-independent)